MIRLKWIYASIIFCFLVNIFPSNIFAQRIFTPDFVVVSGWVLDVDNDSLLPFANIYNPVKMKGTMSKTNGEFRYFAFPGDTLWISSMGYYPLAYLVPDCPGEEIRDSFYLKEKIFRIPDVEIVALTRYEKLRFDVKKMKISVEVSNARKNFPFINQNVLAFHERNNDNFGFVGSPISALYEAFSKEGKERRKLAKLKAGDKVKEEVEERYNIDIVKQITGFNDSTANLFIEYCNFSDEFLLKASEYYIIEVTLEHYREFCVINSIDER